MAQKITHWLLTTLILSLGFGQLLRFDFYGLPIYLHDVLVILILCLQIYKVRNFVIPAGLKLFFLGLALGWIRALTLYPVSELAIPALYTLRLLAYLGLFLSLKNYKIHLPKQIFLITGCVTLVIGFAQYLLLPDMRVFQYLGWDDHLNRLTLPHFDPTFTAVMLSLSFLSLIPTRSSILHPIFSLLAILLTYSRSVWLSLAITFATIIKPKSYLLLLVPILLVAIYLLPKRFGEGTNLLRTYSISSRLNSDISYIQEYKWDLLIGRGLNTLILDTEPTKYDDHATGPNSSYLYLLTTTGLLGLVGWGIFMYSLYAKSCHKPMLIFFFVSSLFNNVMFYPFALLWILLIETMVPTSA